MKVRINGIEKHFRTVWMEGSSIYMINQPLLPHKFKIFKAKTYLDTVEAIKDMTVRGAGAIGATAGYAMAQAALEALKQKGNMGFYNYISNAEDVIKSSRPTAQNLFYAVDRVLEKMAKSGGYEEAAKNVFGANFEQLVEALADKVNLEEMAKAAVKEANQIADDDANACRKIGEYGNTLLGVKDSVLTHCNAGWLAFVDYGSALSPVYAAKAAGKKIIVYSDETRPRLQGANLTAWELLNEGIEHYVIPDNAAGAFMREGKIGLVIVGADRIANNGDTANKIGTYEKAICARAAGIPFYVAAPTSTIDVKCRSGRDIPIEYRSEDEVHWVNGITASGRRTKVRITPEGSKALNPAFDVTPAEYISGFITEKGILFNENKGFDFEKL